MVMKSKKRKRKEQREIYNICVRTSFLHYMIIFCILELYGQHENDIYLSDSGTTDCSEYELVSEFNNMTHFVSISMIPV